MKFTPTLHFIIQGVFFNWYPPKKLKYGKPRLGDTGVYFVSIYLGFTV